MFGTKTNVRNFLAQIGPWAAGVDGRGWDRSDFYEQNAETGEESPREAVRDYRTDPTHVIFPLPTYQVTVLDRLFLGARGLRAVMFLNQAITNFNALNAAFERAGDRDLKWHTCVMLHVGGIGNRFSGGLHAAHAEAGLAVK